MSIENKTAQLLTKLIRETSKGGINWDVKIPPRSLREATEKVVPLYLQAEYKEKILGIYEVRTKTYHDEQEFHWSDGIGFCIVDDQGRVIWELNQYSNLLEDLFNTAREQASGIGDIFDDLLGS